MPCAPSAAAPYDERVSYAPPPDSTAAPPRTARPVRVWDIVLTVVLLILLAIFAALASYFGLFLAMASDGCFDDNCNDGLLTFGVWFAAISPWVTLLLGLVGAVILLVVRRVAFWVPLVSAALMVLTFFVAVAIVGAAVGA
ncbi:MULTISPECIES: DUF6264 family protein [Microbacterium]|uniref:DUF6264 family protein n=1 Tax=Microbacterium TaxID=33882 RepID=UPI0021C47B32|nr:MULTISPECIES: DUF6264 family protein [Microbacterium]